MAKENFVELHEKLVNAAFDNAGKYHLWNDRRGLQRELYGQEYCGYSDILPRFEETSLRWLINRGVWDNYKAGKPPASIVDIGCGPTAKFLHDLSLDCGKELATYTGINAVISQPEQQDSNIKLIQGDAQYPGKYIPKHSADYVTSVNVFQYLADPFLGLIAINELLKPGKGIAFVSDVPLTSFIPELKQNPQLINPLLQSFVDNLGMTIEIDTSSDGWSQGQYSEVNLAWRHSTQRDFTFPLKYLPETIHQKFNVNKSEVYEFETVGYALAPGFLLTHASP